MVKIVYYDDQSKPQISAEQTDKLISQDHVRLLLGPYGSPATFADAAIGQQRAQQPNEAYAVGRSPG
jgi:branched-chain amino acid transport system substrate-binding protein